MIKINKKAKFIFNTIVILTVMLIFLSAGTLYYFNNNTEVTVLDADINLNGISIANEKMSRPLILYNNTPYLPLTKNYCEGLGLSIESNSNEIKIDTIETVNEINKNSSVNNDINKSYNAQKLTSSIIINGTKVNVTDKNPILEFRKTIYLPLENTSLIKNFEWKYNYSPHEKLSIIVIRKQYYSDGTLKYDGEIKNNLPDGFGIYYYKNGDIYKGRFVKNKKSGKGELEYKNGDLYSGEFSNDQKNGKGVYTWANGEKYNGDWKEDMINGQGTYKFKNGDEYSGAWFNNKMHGEGIYTPFDGISIDGTWENNHYQEECSEGC